VCLVLKNRQAKIFFGLRNSLGKGAAVPTLKHPRLKNILLAGLWYYNVYDDLLPHKQSNDRVAADQHFGGRVM